MTYMLSGSDHVCCLYLCMYSQWVSIYTSEGTCICKCVMSVLHLMYVSIIGKHTRCP